MAKTFGIEQQSGEAQLSRVNTNPTRLTPRAGTTSGAIASGLGSIIDVLTDLSEDKEQRGLGNDLANARKTFGSITNAGELKIAQEQALQRLTKKYGARHLSTIRTGLAAQLTSSFNAESGLVTVTNPATGVSETVATTVSANPDQLAIETTSNAAARAAELTQNLAIVSNRLFGAEEAARLKANKPSLFQSDAAPLLITAGDAASDTIERIGLLNGLMLSLERNPGKFGEGQLPSIREQMGQNIKNQIYNSLSMFMSTAMMTSLATGDNVTLTPSSMVEMFTAYQRDLTIELNQSGAATRLGIDMRQLNADLTASAKELRIASTHFFNNELEKANMHNAKAEAHFKERQLDARDLARSGISGLDNIEARTAVMQSLTEAFALTDQAVALTAGARKDDPPGLPGEVLSKLRDSLAAVPKQNKDAAEAKKVLGETSEVATPEEYVAGLEILGELLDSPIAANIIPQINEDAPAFFAKAERGIAALREQADARSDEGTPEGDKGALQDRKQALIWERNLERGKSQLQTFQTSFEQAKKRLGLENFAPAPALSANPANAVFANQTVARRQARQKARRELQFIADDVQRIEAERTRIEAKPTAVAKPSEPEEGTGKAVEGNVEPIELEFEGTTFPVDLGEDTGGISPGPLTFLKQIETFQKSPKDDGSGNSTVGFGHEVTKEEKKAGTFDKPLTLAKANELLAQDMVRFNTAIDEAIIVQLFQNQRDALLVFAFNTGVGAFKRSALVKVINKGGSDAEITKEFAKWVHATNSRGKKIKLNGLIKRQAVVIQIWRGKASVSKP